MLHLVRILRPIPLRADRTGARGCTLGTLRWARLASTLLLASALIGCRAAVPPGSYDVILRGGTVYDGTGRPGVRSDLGIRADRVAFVGDLSGAHGELELRVDGLAVAPGFINMLSWASESLLVDPRALSDITQGVTTEIFGEGLTMGPLNDATRAELIAEQSDLRFDVPWRTLGEYLQHVERRGTAPNIASFVGAATVRMHVLGHAPRDPSEAELEAMCALVVEAMREGALGVSSALIYAPGVHASQAELTALCAAAAPYGGRYATHLRSEGGRLLEAIDEAIRIASDAGVGLDIYHLKAAGQGNWSKHPEVLARIDAERASGLDVAANMYTYTAAATGLDAAMPPWVQAGGREAWFERLRDPEQRARALEAMRTARPDWENLLAAAGSAENVLLVEFANPELKQLTGQSLAAVAAQRGVSPEDAAIDLVLEDGSRVGAVYFLMSEANVRAQLARPWMSLGSDGSAPAPEVPFTRSNPHPRAYGNFARLFARYVRDESLLSLSEAVRRVTSQPADRLGLTHRGRLRPGAYADVAVFDPAAIQDHATFDRPHQLSTGVEHVFVNGTAVLLHGAPTESTPGRFLRGPGVPTEALAPQ